MIRSISRLFWEVQLSESEIERILRDHQLSEKGINKKMFYHKLLTTYTWYQLIDILGLDNLKSIISNTEVLNGLFPKTLKRAYQNAAGILSE